LNHLSNVQIDHLALGKDNGTLTFKLPSDDYIGNAVGENIKKSSSDSKDVFILEQVEMLTLDAYAQKNNITRCDFIKIDIEGAGEGTHEAKEVVPQAPQAAVDTSSAPTDKKTKKKGKPTEVVAEEVVKTDKTESQSEEQSDQISG